MASVYRCHEPSLDRQVALKVLPREFLHEDTFAERFRREAKVIARLEHPNIVPIHSYGIEDGIPWMAMRLVSGGSLSGILKDKRLDMRQIVSVLRGVADALDYAHSQGIVHRDVKPQNILLDDAARVYLADFGIAKIVESSGGLTATGMITGTPQYMAPEQAKGQGIDHRADIYALGIVAYELLTGQTPFSADTPVGVLMKHLSEPVPRPSAIDVPPGASEALLKCLAKDPDERWPTALAFVEALELGLLPTAPTVPQAAVAAPAVTARTTEPPNRQATRALPVPKAARSSSSSVGLFLLLGAVGLVLIGALGVGVYYITRPTPPSATATTSQADAAPAPVVTVPATSPSGEVAPSSLSPTATSLSATAPPSIAPGTVAPEPTRHRPGPPSTGSPAVAATTDTTLPPPSTSPSLTTTPSAPAPSVPAVASLPGTIDFATGVVPLELQSGALSAASVRFQTRDGRSGRFKRMITKGEDIVTVTASFEILRKRKAGDWKLALTVELLDEVGKSVGSFTDRADIEDDKTTVNLVHEMSKKDLALVKHARIGFVAAQ